MCWMAQVRFLAMQDLPLLCSVQTTFTQELPGPPSPGIKWQGREADYSPQSSAEVKNGGAIPTLPHVFMAQCVTN
jgi:hypothetical protein